LPLVKTPRHEKYGTQDEYGDHASGQKTAAVTSHEIHHVGSRKWLILRPKRIASIPSSNRHRLPPLSSAPAFSSALQIAASFSASFLLEDSSSRDYPAEKWDSAAHDCRRRNQVDPKN